VRKNLASIKAIQIRPVSKAAARKEILDYMKKHKEAYASDIYDELGLDLNLVFTIMKELNTEGVVE
jgi:predicted ArsR family transcriptional regulator